MLKSSVVDQNSRLNVGFGVLKPEWDQRALAMKGQEPRGLCIHKKMLQDVSY